MNDKNYIQYIGIKNNTISHNGVECIFENGDIKELDGSIARFVLRKFPEDVNAANVNKGYFKLVTDQNTLKEFKNAKKKQLENSVLTVPITTVKELKFVPTGVNNEVEIRIYYYEKIVLTFFVKRSAADINKYFIVYIPQDDRCKRQGTLDPVLPFKIKAFIEKIMKKYTEPIVDVEWFERKAESENFNVLLEDLPDYLKRFGIKVKEDFVDFNQYCLQKKIQPSPETWNNYLEYCKNNEYAPAV